VNLAQRDLVLLVSVWLAMSAFMSSKARAMSEHQAALGAFMLRAYFPFVSEERGIKIDISGKRTARHRARCTCFSRGSKFFGIHVQFWMPLVAVIAAIAIV
jgi:hypothetical protein